MELRGGIRMRGTFLCGREWAWEKRERKYVWHTKKNSAKKKRILNGENQSDWGGNDFFLLFSTTFFDVARCEREMTKRWERNDFCEALRNFWNTYCYRKKSCYERRYVWTLRGSAFYLSKTYPKLFCPELFFYLLSATVHLFQEKYECYESVWIRFHIMPEM